MKNLFRYLFITMLAVAVSCNESEDIVTGNAKEGGLTNPTSTAVNYVIGEPEGPYSIELFVRQGDVKTSEIRLYKSFVKTERWTEVVDGEEVEMDSTFTSNEVLVHTFDITDPNPHFVSVGYTLPELASGLEVASRTAGPVALPTDDTEYTIGDRWVFRIESTLEDGRIVQQPAPVNVSVSTRYAGTYKVVKGAYWRNAGAGWENLGVTADFPETVVIESVDPTTYRLLDYWAVFEGNEILFTIDDGVISYVPDQVFNDQPMIICETSPASDFHPEVNCGNTNYVINDDVTGRDRLVMTNGYYTAGSGPRVMHQVLEKIVN